MKDAFIAEKIHHGERNENDNWAKFFTFSSYIKESDIIHLL